MGTHSNTQSMLQPKPLDFSTTIAPLRVKLLRHNALQPLAQLGGCGGLHAAPRLRGMGFHVPTQDASTAPDLRTGALGAGGRWAGAPLGK